MRLKSFYGSSLNEAMRQVREALGDNAIIVTTRDDENGGVRVTAAIDETPVSKQESAPPSPPDATENEVIELLATALLKHQVPTFLAERFLATATQFADDDPILCLAAAFDTHLFFPKPAETKSLKTQIFVGSPGAGKTLTTAKLATQAVLAKQPVSVISTDVERAGGMEQLAAFTRLLKLDLIEIEDAHALSAAVSIQPPENAILVDAPGLNPFESAERKVAEELISAAGGNAILVLPAGLDAMEAIDMAQAFRQAGASRLLFTRLDMTRRLGTILRVAFETKMQLVSFTASHKVTEAPTSLNPVTLARLILPPSPNAKATRSGQR
jgi:flagellar biosynthesis protein FlhF